MISEVYFGSDPVNIRDLPPLGWRVRSIMIKFEEEGERERFRDLLPEECQRTVILPTEIEIPSRRKALVIERPRSGFNALQVKNLKNVWILLRRELDKQFNQSNQTN